MEQTLWGARRLVGFSSRPLRASPPLRGSIASDTEMRKRSFRHSISSRAAAVGIVPAGRGPKGASSGEGVRQAHNLDELIRLQARTADQGPVDFGLRDKCAEVLG